MPPRVLTNADLEKMVDTTDEWILQRTGIRERHIVDPGVATSDLGEGGGAQGDRAAPASRPTTSASSSSAPSTPDMMFPSTACLLQHKIGAQHAWGFDLSAACSAFTYALTTASQMVATGAHEHALVVGADVMSSIIDYTDRATCVLFGDGAGAVVVSAADERRTARSSTSSTRSTAAAAPALCMPAGGSLQPASHETVDQRLHYVKQDGADGVQVRRAQDRGDRAARARAQRPRRRPTSICSCRTRPTAASSSRRPRSSASIRSKVIINIERFGNTTAATIPLALNDAVASGRLKKGDLVLLASVGAGFTVGAVLLRWGF